MVQQSSQTYERQERRSDRKDRAKSVVKIFGSVLAATAITGAFYAAILYHAIDDAFSLRRRDPRKDKIDLP